MGGRLIPLAAADGFLHATKEDVCWCVAALTAGAPTPSPLEQAITRLRARRTLQSFAALVGVLHFGTCPAYPAPYLLHYLSSALRRA